MSLSDQAVSPPKVSEILRQFIADHQDQGVTIQQMTHAFGERAFGFLLLFFALICMIPLPIPGIHMFLSIPLFYLSFQQMLGRHEVWFPEKVQTYAFPSKALSDVGLKTIPWIEKIEHLFQPRMVFLTEKWPYRFFGAMIFYITAFLSIPLPLTNFVPAIAIALMAIGLLVKDGAMMLIGSVVGILWSLLWFGVVIVIGIAGLNLFFTKLMQWSF